MYQGKTLSLKLLKHGLVEMNFDRENHVINKLDKLTIQEIYDALRILTEHSPINGLILTSAKDVFIAGADITEFTALFGLAENEIIVDTTNSNNVLSMFENLPFPTLSILQGQALGGGLELALTTDFRVMSKTTKLGLPEVNLGLFPGFGGTVRLARISSVDTAVQLITTGQPVKADYALAHGIVDAISEPEQLFEISKEILLEAHAGKRNWQQIRQQKKGEVIQSKRLEESQFSQYRSQLEKKFGLHRRAAVMALDLLQYSMKLDSEAALKIETATFAKIAKTQAASSLVQAFLNTQSLKKKIKSLHNPNHSIQNCTVIGAGIMGGGIAFINAYKGIQTKVIDLSEQALLHSSEEFNRLVTKQLAAKKIDQTESEKIQNLYQAQLDDTGINHNQLIIEAVTEKLEIKRQVLSNIERKVNENCLIATNTSSFCLAEMSDVLKFPQRFIGLHFFNPVPAMPLVEVVRGQLTDSQSVSQAVNYVLQLGKTPVVVNDCAGFLVNRILTPYMLAFLKLASKGISIQQIDRALQNFGWPMGPAYLQDVVGLDTLIHVLSNIAKSYSTRMHQEEVLILQKMVKHGYLGQKNNIGFYQYHTNSKGKLEKVFNAKLEPLLGIKASNEQLLDQDIVYLLMLPMLLEAVTCLEERIVDSAFELDIAVNMGIGFPAYLGGPLKYIDWLGAGQIIELAEKYDFKHLIPECLRGHAKNKAHFYQ